MNVGLLASLSASKVDYRRPLSIVDPEYHEWRPEGKPKHRLDHIAGIPLLTDETEGVCYLLGELSEADAAAVASFVSGCDLNELNVAGEASFHMLRNRLTNGQWRLSRNYEAAADGFLPRPCYAVRLLAPDDRPSLEATLKALPALAGSRSAMRDFDFMAAGLPVVCYGAIVDARLVGFCSSNPMYHGITEISWIAVADEYRRRGIASGLLTAQAADLFGRGNRAAYYAGSAGTDLHAMLRALAFREVKGTYRFVPTSAREQWRSSWGLAM